MTPAGGEPYNIVPIHDLLAEHPSLRFPELRAAAAALRTVGGLRPPPFTQWRADQDLMDWLGAFFGFQRDNVRNQREHLVLLLANAQMRLSSADFSDTFQPRIARQIRRKLLRNYTSWCGFLGRRPNVYVPDKDPRADLLFAGLYLLVWGEAANLRFVPECLCYIYHHMALELHRILEGYIDTVTGRPANPAVHGENAFLTQVVTPIYGVIRAEVDSSRNGTAPHAAWRNYDDINEYFWRRDVFDRLGWPMEQSRQFFRTTPPDRSRVRKTGFVEVRSFWNIYRSFDRLWVMLLLYLQAAAITAWEGAMWPWEDPRSSQDTGAPAHHFHHLACAPLPPVSSGHRHTVPPRPQGRWPHASTSSAYGAQGCCCSRMGPCIFCPVQGDMEPEKQWKLDVNS
jgi:callose synthase